MGKKGFTANENSMKDHDKNQELCVSDEQPDGAVPVEDMYKTELHSIAAEPTKLAINSTNKVPQMEDMGKGDEYQEPGECLLVQSQSELPSLAIESEIQSHGPIMISIDDKGVGSFPPKSVVNANYQASKKDVSHLSCHNSSSDCVGAAGFDFSNSEKEAKNHLADLQLSFDFENGPCIPSSGFSSSLDKGTVRFEKRVKPPSDAASRPISPIVILMTTNEISSEGTLLRRRVKMNPAYS
ncbi:hypothetical protein RND71_037001 [Anisodus tanguticus]|uniref:Uncharacterized protein n=1 Tax=Anisodus tanguticus TaxID=243964 RepID=A0AAE1R542_9SOLA|nr:hypothetical protein RND71_037001 [Anisodus tanguticus]